MTVTASLIPLTSTHSSPTEAVVLRYYPPSLLALFIAVCLLPRSAAAEEVQTLAPVIVVGSLEPPPAPAPALDQKVIRQLPSGNGSLSELLRFLPGAQLSEDYNSAATGGEILPPTISISGGKVYQNNFLVDGIGNNNLIDPASNWGDDYVTDAPGHPLERFLSSELIDSITLYECNVPARFGSFAGGVVEATTRNPGKEVEGHLSYRTTRNQWTKFHIVDADQGDFAAGGRADLQPEFTKNDYDATLSLPLTAQTGILMSWSLLDSQIPLPYFLTTRTQERRQQSYFIKYVAEVSGDDHLALTVNSTPYRSNLFLQNTQGSDYVVKMEGLAVQGEWKHFFPAGEVELNGAYRRSRNSRSGPQHFRSWLTTDSKDWGREIGSEFSVEGGFGTIEKFQESFDLKSLLRLELISPGALRHEVTSGIDFSRTLGSFERQGTTYVYKEATPSADIICGANDFDCVEHEQFFALRTVYDAGMSRAAIDQLALHVEDLLRYQRLELRPGLRLEYNDLMEEANLAPRFFASYDLFGSGETILSAGASRYYGSTLLTDKLREAKTPFRSESRTSVNLHPSLWVAASEQGPYVTRFTKLSTPYTDELDVGFEQKVAGGLLKLVYLRREGRDEFARTYSPLQPDGLRYYTLNNLGRTHHERYSLTWERSWSRYSLSWNATLQETKTTNDSYDDSLESGESSGQIWYQDQLIFKSDLPARNQNRKFNINLIWVAELPASFTFTNYSRYRSGYREIVSTGEVRPIPSGSGLDAVAVYEEITHPGKVIFDWKLGWSTPLYHQQRLLFSLEINNVFNSRLTQASKTTTIYEMGRQFWASVAYDY